MNWGQVESQMETVDRVPPGKTGASSRDDDLQQISGKREQLAVKIEETYGITRREAEKQVWDWGKTVEHVRRRSRSMSAILRTMPFVARPERFQAGGHRASDEDGAPQPRRRSVRLITSPALRQSSNSSSPLVGRGFLHEQLASRHPPHRVDASGFVHRTVEDPVCSNPLHVGSLIVLLREQQQRRLALR